MVLKDDILATLKRLRPRAIKLGTQDAIYPLIAAAEKQRNDALWIRESFQASGSLADVVRLQAARWREEPSSGSDPELR